MPTIIYLTSSPGYVASGSFHYKHKHTHTYIFGAWPREKCGDRLGTRWVSAGKVLTMALCFLPDVFFPFFFKMTMCQVLPKCSPTSPKEAPCIFFSIHKCCLFDWSKNHWGRGILCPSAFGCGRAKQWNCIHWNDGVYNPSNIST